MGLIVKYKDYSRYDTPSRLLVFSSATEQLIQSSISVNKLLAIEINKIDEKRRTIQLEKCFLNVLEGLPSYPTIRGIDVLFNPDYRVDILKLLISAHKNRPFRLIWPCKCNGGKLIYSEEDYPDYRVFDINDYDITVVE